MQRIGNFVLALESVRMQEYCAGTLHAHQHMHVCGAQRFFKHVVEF
jgi:hypothetical protein